MPSLSRIRVPVACPATSQAVLEAAPQPWSACRSRDAGTWDKLVDDSFISTDDAGARKGKQELLAQRKEAEGHVHNETEEQATDVRLAFANGVAILNVTGHWTDHDKIAGISFNRTSIMTRVCTCKHGEWKLVSFHETGIANPNRQPVTGAWSDLTAIEVTTDSARTVIGAIETCWGEQETRLPELNSYGEPWLANSVVSFYLPNSSGARATPRNASPPRAERIVTNLSR